MLEHNTTKKLKVMDLFSGIGGFSLGLERTGGFETVCFAEIDPFCQKVLKKHWPHVPIHNDVRTLDYDGSVDVITGGYPCQPFSTAGNRKGKDDDRHLWPAMFDLIKKYRPSWVIGENVAGHISMGLDDVLSDLESEVYTARTFVIPACAVDAKHRRDRVWIVGNAQHDGRATAEIGRSIVASGYNDKERQIEAIESSGTSGREHNEDVGDPISIGQPGSGKSGIGRSSATDGKGQTDYAFSERQFREWPPEPAVGRVAHGIPRRVDRLRSLGNAVVPQIPEIIGYAILTTLQEDHTSHAKSS